MRENRFISIVKTNLFEMLYYIVVFLLMHYMVLMFIYPGYYDPFWPVHSDLYVPAAFANMENGSEVSLSYPRPIGYFFYWMIGHFGIRGSIAAGFMLMPINFSLITIITRRILKINFTVNFSVSIALFAYLIVAQPYQYVFSVHDGFTQLSLMFLLLATVSYYKNKYIVPVFIFTLLAFFSKETYAASVLFICGVFVFFGSGELKQRLKPFLIVVLSILIVVLFNKYTNSVFTSTKNSLDSAYYVNVNPLSILKEWIQYLIDGYNYYSLIIVVLVLMFIILSVGFKSIEVLFCLTMFVAGLLSWLPNSLLPNHHYSAYSWNGAYFIYIPVVFVFFVIKDKSIKIRLFSWVWFVLLMFIPYFSSGQYEKTKWILIQQQIQKNFMLSLESIPHYLFNKESDVLVTGVVFPFTPFEHWQSLLSLNFNRCVNINVVNYKSTDVAIKKIGFSNKSCIQINEISPIYVKNHHFDLVLAVNSDGKTLNNQIFRGDNLSLLISGVNLKNVLLYPDMVSLHDVIKSKLTLSDEDLINYGNTMMIYSANGDAINFFDKALEVNNHNPYSYFGLGQAYERDGNYLKAKENFQKAIKFDAEQANPNFKNALENVLKVEYNNSGVK